MLGGGAIAPLNLGRDPQMWHEPLFDELKASEQVQKERSVTFKMCQNSILARYGSWRRSAVSLVGWGGGHPFAYTTLLGAQFGDCHQYF